MAQSSWEEEFNEEFPGKVDEACLSKKDVKAFIRRAVREATLAGFDEAVKVVERYAQIDDYIPNGEVRNSLSKRRAELAGEGER